jgi:hypothetical protein
MAARVDLDSTLAWPDTIGDEKIRRAGFVDVVDEWIESKP